MLHTRKVGRTVLGIREGITSTLMDGRARKDRGYGTCYVVVAMATAGRDEVALGSFPSLRTACEYVELYEPRFGLVTKG